MMIARRATGRLDGYRVDNPDDNPDSRGGMADYTNYMPADFGGGQAALGRAEVSTAELKAAHVEALEINAEMDRSGRTAAAAQRVVEAMRPHLDDEVVLQGVN